MIEKAISKIRTEMDQKQKNAYVQVIGNFLIQYLEKHPEAAENIATSNKSVEKSLDEMRKVAETKKVGNCAVLTDDEGFTIVLKYFGLKYDTKESVAQPVIQPTREQPVPNKSSDKAFDINLDDLLG